MAQDYSTELYIASVTIQCHTLTVSNYTHTQYSQVNDKNRN